MMRLSFAVLAVVLTIPTAFGATDNCSHGEAEALNSSFTGKGVTIDPTSDAWTAELSRWFEDLKTRFLEVSERHTAAISADDQASLNAVCEDYRGLLAEMDDLAKNLK